MNKHNHEKNKIMNLYFDTNIWIDYLDEKRALHEQAKKLFQFIEQKKHLLIVTELHIYETKTTGYYEKFEVVKNELWKKGICKGVKITKEQKEKAKKMNKKLNIGIADCLHLIVGEEKNCLLVSSDRHWKKASKKTVGYKKAIEKLRL